MFHIVLYFKTVLWYTWNSSESRPKSSKYFSATGLEPFCVFQMPLKDKQGKFTPERLKIPQIFTFCSLEIKLLPGNKINIYRKNFQNLLPDRF